MKKPMIVNLSSVLVLMLIVFIARVSPKAFGQNPAAAPEPSVPRPNPTGTDPKPENATEAILAAFDKYQIVGLDAAHGNQDLDDLILGLIRNPVLPSKINDIAVECGNSFYQPILDRYMAGDAVPLSEVQQTWRNTTQPMCNTSPFYEELFPLVRKINQKLPLEKRLRVLAGDPPFDWSKLHDPREVPMGIRDNNIASVMEREVLSKHRKALMLFGTFHLLHGTNVTRRFPSAVELYEKHYPGVTLVIDDHEGFGNWTALSKYNDEFEARMASWPVPTLVQIRGTWLAELLDMTWSPGIIQVRFGIQGPKGEQNEVSPVVWKDFSKKVDAYLYLGPRDLLLREPQPAEILLDKEYMAELERRASLTGGGSVGDAKDSPEKITKDPFLFDQNFLETIIQDFCRSHRDHPCVIAQTVYE
jgi:hypothetical protein